ncbi:hypothetical protein [Staphylococcus epidermidis]|nr:hypothetical protein [Staphylococcus epidermidis]
MGECDDIGLNNGDRGDEDGRRSGKLMIKAFEKLEELDLDREKQL